MHLALCKDSAAWDETAAFHEQQHQQRQHEQQQQQNPQPTGASKTAAGQTPASEPAQDTARSAAGAAVPMTDAAPTASAASAATPDLPPGALRFTIAREDGKLGLSIVGDISGTRPGTYVKSIRNTAAAAAGLTPGSRLLRIGGEDVHAHTQQEVVRMLATAGDKIEIVVVPDADGLAQLESLSTSRSVRLIKGPRGYGISLAGRDDAPHPVFVGSIQPGSPADGRGDIAVGDRIVKINDVPIDLALQRTLRGGEYE